MGSSFDRRLLEILKNAGCTFVRHGKGSHEVWYSPIANINFAVSHDIKSRHTANAILKQAGIDEKL